VIEHLPCAGIGRDQLAAAGERGVDAPALCQQCAGLAGSCRAEVERRQQPRRVVEHRDTAWLLADVDEAAGRVNGNGAAGRRQGGDVISRLQDGRGNLGRALGVYLRRSFIRGSALLEQDDR